MDSGGCSQGSLLRKAIFATAFCVLQILTVSSAGFTSIANADVGNTSLPTWEHWLGAGAIFYEADEENESAQLYEYKLGYNIDPHWTIEGGFGGSPFQEGNNFSPPDGRAEMFNNKGTTGDNWMLKSNIDALYHFDGDPGRVWDPYVSVGGGMLYYGKRREDGNWDPAGTVGFGVGYKVSDDLSVRGDYKLAFAGDDVERDHHVLVMAKYNWGKLFGRSGDTSAEYGKEAQPDLGAATSSPLHTIYFDYDKAELKGEAESKLQKNAEWLKANPGTKVSVEGHCDERGTNEYNMALGHRRAQSSYEYLRTLGVPKEQMSTVSFGEEFPANPGHDESAWSKNRRVESVIKK